jgi:hypothetical protein
MGGTGSEEVVVMAKVRVIINIRRHRDFSYKAATGRIIRSTS